MFINPDIFHMLFTICAIKYIIMHVDICIISEKLSIQVF